MKAADMEIIAESDKRGCIVTRKCGSVEFFCSFVCYLHEKTASPKALPS